MRFVSNPDFIWHIIIVAFFNNRSHNLIWKLILFITQ